MDGSRHRIPSFRDWFNSFIRPPHSIFIGPCYVILSVVESYPSQLSGVKSVSGSSGEKNYIIITSVPFVLILHQAHSQDLNLHRINTLRATRFLAKESGESNVLLYQLLMQYFARLSEPPIRTTEPKPDIIVFMPVLLQLPLFRIIRKG